MNNFVIEQTKDESQLAISLHQNAELGGIRLASAKVTGDSPNSVIKEPILVSMDIKAKHIKDAKGKLVIEVCFRLTGVKKSDPSKDKAVLCIECAFEASYHLKAGFEPTEEQIKAFKDGNAIFNCWPYHRQYVQDVILRMGYPAITLPFLRVVTKQQKKRNSSNSN